MQRELSAYLWDIREAVLMIQGYAQKHTREQYLADGFAQAAIERKFEIIGEAMKQGSRIFPEQLGALPNLSKAVRFRDRLAHGYFAVNSALVRDAIHAELPALLAAIECIETEN